MKGKKAVPGKSSMHATLKSCGLNLALASEKSAAMEKGWDGDGVGWCWVERGMYGVGG